MSELEVQEYLFDLQGYLVIEDVLNAKEVASLNRLLDEKILNQPGDELGPSEFGVSGLGNEDAGFLEWGSGICDLLDHQRIMPVLKFVLGDGFRIDHWYGIQMRVGTEGLRIHGGDLDDRPGQYYYYADGRMHNGLTVVSWNLADTGPEHGGFLCVPGSHKDNLPRPGEIDEAHDQASCVAVLEAKAGSVIIFTERLAHGTADWKASYNRRSLLFKYMPADVVWRRWAPHPLDGVELTTRQRLLFERPSRPGPSRRFPETTHGTWEPR